MLTGRHESEHSCLIPDFGGGYSEFSLLPIMMSGVGFLYMLFIILRNFHFIPSLLSVFYHERC